MNRRKQWIAGLLAALLLLSLAGCKKETPPQEPAETPPEAELPNVPETPTEPDPSTEPADPQPEPPADVPPEVSGVAVSDLTLEGSVEETVSYQLVRPEIHTGSDSVDQILNDYYQSVYGKLTDYAWGEVYEQAMEAHSMIHMDAAYQVMLNDGRRLSIYRTVSISYLEEGAIPIVTAYAETFDLEAGGLMTSQDFFDADEAAYTQRLTECVAQSIQEDPYHDQTYFAQWEDAVTRTFNKDQFYITDDAYVVFYQENQLGGAAETVYPIPWSRLEDLLKP